ncbi:hypothetical protein DFJ74DRAFT_756197 [Hyaloraphidium curvatum]|nr:hypothetical protein DFJ74DRAFT_756197 [Hyaloraphidium curvatum]
MPRGNHRPARAAADAPPPGRSAAPLSFREFAFDFGAPDACGSRGPQRAGHLAAHAQAPPAMAAAHPGAGQFHHLLLSSQVPHVQMPITATARALQLHWAPGLAQQASHLDATRSPPEQPQHMLRTDARRSPRQSPPPGAHRRQTGQGRKDHHRRWSTSPPSARPIASERRSSASDSVAYHTSAPELAGQQRRGRQVPAAQVPVRPFPDYVLDAGEDPEDEVVAALYQDPVTGQLTIGEPVELSVVRRAMRDRAPESRNHAAGKPPLPQAQGWAGNIRQDRGRERRPASMYAMDNPVGRHAAPPPPLALAFDPRSHAGLAPLQEPTPITPAHAHPQAFPPASVLRPRAHSGDPARGGQGQLFLVPLYPPPSASTEPQRHSPAYSASEYDSFRRPVSAGASARPIARSVSYHEPSPVLRIWDSPVRAFGSQPDVSHPMYPFLEDRHSSDEDVACMPPAPDPSSRRSGSISSIDEPRVPSRSSLFPPLLQPSPLHAPSSLLASELVGAYVSPDPPADNFRTPARPATAPDPDPPPRFPHSPASIQDSGYGSQPSQPGATPVPGFLPDSALSRPESEFPSLAGTPVLPGLVPYRVFPLHEPASDAAGGGLRCKKLPLRRVAEFEDAFGATAWGGPAPYRRPARPYAERRFEFGMARWEEGGEGGWTVGVVGGEGQEAEGWGRKRART